MDTIDNKIQSEILCPSCHTPISSTDNFCPRCGTKLKEVSPPISAKKLAVVFLISFFLAPFGLGYAYKYLKQPEPKARRVGIVVIMLTIIAIVLMVWITSAVVAWETEVLNSIYSINGI